MREQRMFGGLAFLVNGNMAVAASGQGGILVRVDPAEATTNAEMAVMGQRMMRGWLRVAHEHVPTKGQLGPWVRRGVDHARMLPVKGRRST